jgi:MoaA/NifB/PqqE/SkfB family radical SAM enzyme
METTISFAIGVQTVQFIGGEPTLDPDLPRLLRYALAVRLKVDVYTNLVHMTPALWELFALPGVSVGFSWYSADASKHAEVTGSRASHACTRANIAKAVRRGVRLRAGIVKVVDGQDIEAAMADLRALGVTAMHADRSRSVGRAANGAQPSCRSYAASAARGAPRSALTGSSPRACWGGSSSQAT